MSSAFETLVRKQPDLAPAVDTLRRLATGLPDASLPPGVPNLEAAQTRLDAGIPALDGEPLLSSADLARNVDGLGTLIDLPGGTGWAVHLAEMEDCAAWALTGAWEQMTDAARRVGVEPDLAVTVFDYAARPALRAGAQQVRTLLAETRWTRGPCPACGSPPLLAELRGGSSGGAEQERVFRCGRCISQWSFPRLRCLSCGETDHTRLRYVHGAGENTFRRAEVCLSCRTYVKSIAVLGPMTLDELLAADLVTTPLDLAAVERGFHR